MLKMYFEKILKFTEEFIACNFLCKLIVLFIFLFVIYFTLKKR